MGKEKQLPQEGLLLAPLDYLRMVLLLRRLHRHHLHRHDNSSPQNDWPSYKRRKKTSSLLMILPRSNSNCVGAAPSLNWKTPLGPSPIGSKCSPLGGARPKKGPTIPTDEQHQR